MELHSHLDFRKNEAQNVVIHNVSALDATPKNGMLQYLTDGGAKGLYLYKEGNWIHLGQVEALINGGISITPVSGVQYLSVNVDGDTIKINGNGDLEVGENAIGLRELDTANIRINDLAAPNANYSMANYKITNLGNPTSNKDAANKEYVDTEIASKVAAMGEFMGDWAGPGYPTVGSGSGGSIVKGDWWRITAEFTLGGEDLEIGDGLFAKINNPGTTGANWFSLQNNVGEATTTALGLVRVSQASDLTANNGANTGRVVRIADLLARVATTSRTGLVQLATQTEMNSGANNTKAVTPLLVATYINTQISSRSYATNIGDGTAKDIVVTHNFGTRDVIVEIYRNSTPWDKILVDVERPTTNSCSINFKTAPASGEYRFVTIKIS